MPTLEKHPESGRLDSLEREMKRVEKSLERRSERTDDRIGRTDDRVEKIDRRCRKSEYWILLFPLRVLLVAVYALLIGFVVFDVIVAAHH